MTGLSILDLTPVRQGSDAASALRDTLALAQLADSRGYHRYWLVEHHATAGVAGAATAVVIGHIAAHTKNIRVGAGGIMLPNHAPLIVAEQFGTLAAFHPGRIDLGLGRGIASDPATLQALRRQPNDAAAFPSDVQELLAYFDGRGPVKAVPGEGADVPVWILSSSLGGAQLAAAMGLPYAFASHFAPDDLSFAIQLYRQQFRPSRWLDKPYVMLGLNACLADTDADARLLFTSVQQAVVNLRSGQPGPLPPPLPGYEDGLEPHQAAMVGHVLRCAIVGGATSATAALSDFIATHRPDELMVTSQIFDAAARRKSYEILAHIHAPGG